MNVDAAFKPLSSHGTVINRFSVASATIEDLHRRKEVALISRWIRANRQCMGNFELRNVVIFERHQMELVSGMFGLKDLLKRRWPRRGMRIDATVA